MASVDKGYHDPARFKNGAAVLIRDRATLEAFFRTWKYHHKLEVEQLAYAGRAAKVQSSGMYHGGDVVYQLEGVPGVWHEQLLQDA